MEAMPPPASAASLAILPPRPAHTSARASAMLAITTPLPSTNHCCLASSACLATTAWVVFRSPQLVLCTAIPPDLAPSMSLHVSACKATMELQAQPRAKYVMPIFGALVVTMPSLHALAIPLPHLEAQTSPIAAAFLATSPFLLLTLQPLQQVWLVSSVQPTNSARAALPLPAEPIPWHHLALFQLIIAPAMLAFIPSTPHPDALFAPLILTVLEVLAL